MKKSLVLFAFFVWQSLSVYAQQNYYLGFKAEIGSVQPRFSSPLDVKGSVSYGGGLAYSYPFSDTWEMTADVVASFFKVSGTTYEDAKSTGLQTYKRWSLDLNYGFLRGFGDEQHVKVGLGIWGGMIPQSTVFANNTFFADAANSDQKFYLEQLYGTRPNYGVSVEGIYNVNDALQFSLRYKLGLANLYSNGGTQTWRQNTLGLSAIYYFGGESRGTIKTKKTPTGKSKYKW